MALTARKQIISSNLFLKITAFIIGYALWTALSNTQTVCITRQASLAFYNVPDTWRITSADALDVTLLARRAQLRMLSPEKLTVHIDAATLKEGENYIDVNGSSLFLPKQIQIVDYTHPLIVRVDSTYGKNS